MRCVNEDFFNEDYFTLLDVAFKLSDFFEFTIKEESIKAIVRHTLPAYYHFQAILLPLL